MLYSCSKATMTSSDAANESCVITVRVSGWIGTLHADATGMPIARGEPLFTLYSPQLYSAQEEFLTALASQKEAAGGTAPDRANALVRSARERLRLWNLTEAQIEEIAARGAPLEYVPILSPLSGYLLEKMVVEGTAVEPGVPLLRVAALDRIWIEAELYESDLSLVAPGNRVTVTLPYVPDRAFAGRIDYVYPVLDVPTRTGRIRIVIENPDLALKPGMYADVVLSVDRGERLAVPEEAVIYAGTRSLVFLDEGGGKLRPVDVDLGLRAGDWIEIRGGLEAGDLVVTSGNFLIAAESRLKAAARMW